MKAIVYTRYGPPDVLRLTAVVTPTPRDNEVLVLVRAVSLNLSDWETLRGKPLYARIGGPLRPRHRILGSDIAGRVEAVGRDVSRPPVPVERGSRGAPVSRRWPRQRQARHHPLTGVVSR
jgi:NADPH:quinone reductase-like Zn-dependent oxidoreductase